MEKFAAFKLIIVFIFFNLNNVYTQVNVKIYPEKFRVPQQNMDLSDFGKPFARTPWIVLSDRTNNPTFTTWSSRLEMKRIDFLDWFFVTDVTDERIRLAKANWEYFDPQNFTLAKHEDYGWVDKDKMLLWNLCLRTEYTKVARKAMFTNTIELSARNENMNHPGLVSFYETPDLELKSVEKPNESVIYYVYKFSEDGKSLFLGKTTIITDITNAKFDIVGWAPRNWLILWDHRVALEPNWVEEAVAERKRKGVKATIFKDPNEALAFHLNFRFQSNNILSDVEPYETRLDGDFKRFPFYSSDVSNIIKCSAWEFPTTSRVENNSKGVELSGKVQPQFHTTGYTTLKPIGMEYPLFQEVILVSRMEFGGVIDYINKLVNVRSGSQARRMLQDTWLELLRSHTGKDFSNTMDMEMSEVTNILFGAPSKSQYLKGIRLIDIIDLNKFTDDALTRWMQEIQTKLNILRIIQNQYNYRHSFRSNDEVSYWISIYNFP